MANELKLENPLSSDTKPVKINDDVTGLQLSDKNAKIENDLTIGGDLYVNGSYSHAGMILGYRMLGEDKTSSTYALTTSMAVPDSDMTVRFDAPLSGAVEVMVQVYIDQNTTRRNITFGLSDNATYNSIGNSYEHKVMSTDDRENDTVVQNHWTITGLTAGDTYNYWFGAKTSGITATLGWGGTSASEYPDFIMKVTALPTAVSDFAVYG